MQRGPAFVKLVTFMSLGHHPTPGIRFNDCMFSEPIAAAAFTMPKSAGIFAVLVSDPNWAPKAWQALYFGEFGNNTPARALPFNYEQLQAAARGRTLMVSVLPMPFSTTAQRRELCNELVSAYNPECQNTGYALPAADLAARLVDLEKHHRAQTEQVMMLLTNLNQAFLPQPTTPKRRIGFLPDVEKAA